MPFSRVSLPRMLLIYLWVLQRYITVCVPAFCLFPLCSLVVVAFGVSSLFLLLFLFLCANTKPTWVFLGTNKAILDYYYSLLLDDTIFNGVKVHKITNITVNSASGKLHQHAI